MVDVGYKSIDFGDVPCTLTLKGGSKVNIGEIHLGEIEVDLDKVDLDQSEIVAEISTEELADYLDERDDYDPTPDPTTEEDVVDRYWHGEFDLVKVLRSIGLQEAERLLKHASVS